MEVDEIQMQGRKFQRIGNNGAGANKQLGREKSNCQYREDDEELKRNSTSADLIAGGVAGRLCGWPSSRIVRVSRASGGKDRHSKVWTSKGLRDRRVRLSVTTAIQFYDLQDRLGYDQPSKAVEWLLKVAAGSISELPSLEASFPDTPKQISNENSADVVEFNQQNGGSLSKSGCSSTSETSKGSAGLSLSRSESRLKARERARERAAEKEKEKEKENEPLGVIHTQNHHNNDISQNSSFTELLNIGINPVTTNDNPTPSNGTFQMDYMRAHHLPGWGNTLLPFNVTGDQNQFSFVHENLVPIVSSTAGGGGGGHYNLDFSVSSGLAGFNRGTLQSNTSSILPHHYHHHLQRFSPIDGSNIPSFFMAPNAVAMENHQHHHLYQSGIDGRLQPCYGDTVSRHSDLKERGKN